MPAASFYPLILASLLPPLTLFAVLRLCWFFGSRFGYAKNAFFLLIAAVLAGLVLLAMAMLASIWMVLAFLFTWATASAAVAALAFLVLALWVVVPLRMRT